MNSHFCVAISNDQHLALIVDGKFMENTISKIPKMEWVPVAITIRNNNASFYVNRLKTSEVSIPEGIVNPT